MDKQTTQTPLVHAIYHGHAFVEIERGERCVLIDPFVEGNRLCDVSVDELCERDISHIIVTHGHADHLGSTVEIAQRMGATIVATFGVYQALQRIYDGAYEPMHIGGRIELDDGSRSIKYVPAIHGGSMEIDGTTYFDTPGGVIVTVYADCDACRDANNSDQKNNNDNNTDTVIYHMGDTALTRDFVLIGEMYDVDLLLVPIGDRFTMGVDDGIRAVQMINPTTAVPIHYDTFPQITSDPMRFAREVMQQRLATPKVLKAGQCVVLG